MQRHSRFDSLWIGYALVCRPGIDATCWGDFKLKTNNVPHYREIEKKKHIKGNKKLPQRL